MKVRYDGATVNTSFGYIMFEADRLLKCLSLGMDNITKKPFKADVSGYLSLHDRLGGKWKGTINNRMWFIPEKITLIEDESHKGFIFDEVKMQVLTESQKNNLKIDMPQCLAFAKHLNDNYDEYAEHFPVLEKLKKLGKITAIIKWLKDNNILFDTAFFENYSPKYFETPKFTPAIVRNSLGGRSQLFTIGGVIYQLNQNNFTVYNDFLVDNIISTAISSRPSDNDFSWTFNSPVNRENFNAVAQSIYKTKKPGNVKKQFLDMSFSHNKSKIQLFRFYNSFSEDTSFFGYGWRVLPYELKFSLEKMKIEKKDGNDTEICRGIFVKLLDKEDFFEINGLDDGGFPIFKNKSNTYLLKDLLNGSFSLHKQNGEIIAIFDNFGKLIKMLDEDNWTTFEYIQKKLIKICHEKDINITFEYQNDKIVKALGSNGASIIYKYNNLGLLEQISNEIGLDFYYFYDKDKRLNKILDNERNMIFSAVYDDYNRAKETIEGEVRYENEFSLDKKMVKIINPIGEETIFYFDGNDRLVQRKEKNKIMYFSYEQENIFLPTKIMDEMGYATVCRYDNNGNILYLKNIFGAEWEFYYNKNGNLTLERSPMGRWKYYGYDESNRLIRTDLKVDEVIFSSDKSSFSIKSDGRYCLFYNYENQENIVKNITTLGGARASFVYNEFGKLEQVKAPTGYIKKRTFDKKNRLIQISDDFGIEVSYEYNSLNQVEKKITKMGNEQFQYNDFGDLIKVTDAKGNITIREYDSNHNLIKVVDSDMGVFRYEYTSDDKIYRLNYPNGTSKIFEYNSKGLLEFEKDGTN
jgi:YD repeat-containing protein